MGGDKMEEQSQQLVYSFSHGLGEEIQIAIRKFRDKHYIDVRHWFQTKNENVFRPTKKGVFIPIERIGELQKGVERLGKAAESYKTAS
jgi:hypothetical protein